MYSKLHNDWTYDLSLRRVSDGYIILHKAPAYMKSVYREVVKILKGSLFSQKNRNVSAIRNEFVSRVQWNTFQRKGLYVELPQMP